MQKCREALFLFISNISFLFMTFGTLYEVSTYMNIHTLYGWDWVPEIRVPKGNTRTRTKFWVWVGLGLSLNYMGIFGLGTQRGL